jgi:hypothetical protein
VPILLQDILQSDQKKAIDVASGLFRGRRSAGALANTLFYTADHWQNGNGWIGAKPLVAHGLNQTLQQIKEAFVSENVIKEVVDRHVGGILGREPLWGFVPQKIVSRSAETRRRRFSKIFGLVFGNSETSVSGAKLLDKFAQEADEALTVWWDQKQPRKKLKEALTTCLNEDKVLLRFFIPRGLYKNNSKNTKDEKAKLIPVQKSLTDALSLIHLDVIAADKGGVFLDNETQKPFAVYVYEVDRTKCVELSYVNEAGQTILQVLSDDPKLVIDPIPYDLQGRLWMYELSRSALITEQIRSAQKLINLTLTMLMRNVNLAGNLERVIMNAEKPTRKIKIPDTTQESGYRQESIESEWLWGPGATNSLTGLFIKDAEGKIIGRADPNISYHDPVKIDTFVGTRGQGRECVYAQSGQLHIMISGDSTVSGRSREQARAEFRGTLNDSKEPLDNAGRWTMETGLRIAAVLCNRVSDFSGLRCDFDARIEDGPVSPEERDANRSDVKAGLLSKETAMSKNGVEDTDAEKVRIEADKTESPAPLVPPPQPSPTNGDSQLIQ